MSKFWKIFRILAPIATAIFGIGSAICDGKRQEELIEKAVVKHLNKGES